MTNLTVIILTFNEELHIERCIKSLQPVATRIFIVDSYSTDRTLEIAESLGAEIVQRRWKNYADQFQWALDNCEAADFLMRMDADEYIEPDLQSEIESMLPDLPLEIEGVYIRRKLRFLGRWVRFGGTYPLTLLRIWRYGRGRIEQRWMDEHLVLEASAKTVRFDGHIVDDNRKGFTFWIDKHNSYATREMIDVMNQKYNLFSEDVGLLSSNDSQARRKRLIKNKVYSRIPITIRALSYFFYRYFIRLGFLDGNAGFVWHAMQGFWYRLLVDLKVQEVEKKSGGNDSEVRRIIKEDFGVSL